MKNFKCIKKITSAICLTLTLLGCGKTSNVPFHPSTSGLGDRDSAEGIFSEPSDEDTHVSQTEEIHGTRVHQRRLAKLNIPALKRSLESSTGTVTLNLFKDKRLLIQLDSISKVNENNYVATGHINGDLDSSATLVLNEDVIALTVKSSTGEENYEVRYSGKNGHIITEQTEVQDDEESCTTVPAPDSPDDDPIMEEPGTESVLATPSLDMLVAYTPKAQAKAGGANAMRALIQLGIADTNTALMTSGVNLRVRLAGTIQTSTNESSNYSNDLSSLRSKTDKKWNEIHTARAKYRADQVTLIGAYTNVSNPVGIGYFKASKTSAFTIVKYSVISTMFTLAHELGHNIGLAHSDGYVNSSGKFRTIMAYGTYKRIRRFSNPNILYNGYKTGTKIKYEAAIINKNSTRMSSLIQDI